MVSVPRKPGFVFPVVVTLAVLLGLYVGVYLLVRPIDTGGYAVALYVKPWNQGETIGRLRLLFAPIHWLDRRIRPHVWEPK